MGIYYQKNDHLISFTAKKLSGNPYKSTNLFMLNPQHFYTLFAAKKFKLSYQTKLVVSTFITYTFDVPLLMEANLVYYTKLGLWIGAGLRNSAEMSNLIGINLKKLISDFSEDISIGYAYDYGFSMLQKVNAGSHELQVVYKFGKRPSVEEIMKDKKAVHPIFF
jgi:hypothetical protein